MSTANTTIRRHAGRAMARGFSMLELMFVLIIIGVLTAAVAYNYGGFTDSAKRSTTQQNLEKIKACLEMYNGRNSRYPALLVDLVSGGYLDASKRLKDGWGNDFSYDPVGPSEDRPFILFSAGKDGRTGTGDDIDVWAPPAQ